MSLKGRLVKSVRNCWKAWSVISRQPFMVGANCGVSDMRWVINGEDVNETIDARISLLDFLRERLHLFGAKKGCNQGACGACTVLVDGERINSCLALAVQ